MFIDIDVTYGVYLQLTAYPVLNPRADEIDYHTTILKTVNDPSVERDAVLDFDDRDIDVRRLYL